MYQKEIIYVGLYKGGSRIGSAGFLKVEKRDRESRMCLKVQNVPLGISGRFPIRIYNGSDWKELSNVSIQDGGGNWEETMPENVSRTVLLVSLSGGYTLEGRSKSAPEVRGQTTADISVPERLDEQAMQRESRDIMQDTLQSESCDIMQDTPQRESRDIMQDAQQREPQDTAQNVQKATMPDVKPQAAADDEREPETIIVKEELLRPSSDAIDIMPQGISGCNLKENKWEQIMDMYEQIHPYGDERVYVKLEPKDFVILQSKYQHLVNNSFLLHGFYNYRYVILGKEQGYYLGVPGVFYEREKMVAQMFGFEAFECPGGHVRAGEFGYYLRKVEL